MVGGNYISDLSIVVKLIDEVSKPLDIIRQKLDGLNSSVDKSAKSTKTLAQKMGDVRVLSQIRRGNFDQPFMEFNRTIGTSTKKLSAFDKLVAKTANSLGTMEEALPRFQMAALSFIFTGMAMQRMSASFFRFVFGSWEKYEGYQTAASVATMQLTASWEFLRFSIFNALGQSEIFQYFVESLVNAFNWLSQLVSKHPNVVALISAFIGLVGVVGTAMMNSGSLLYGLYYCYEWLTAIMKIKFAGSILETALNLFSLKLSSIKSAIKSINSLLASTGLSSTAGGLLGAATAGLGIAGAGVGLATVGAAAAIGYGSYKYGPKADEFFGMNVPKGPIEVTIVNTDSIKTEVVNTDMLSSSVYGG